MLLELAKLNILCYNNWRTPKDIEETGQNRKGR